jgi:protein-disulfide isomerase
VRRSSRGLLGASVAFAFVLAAALVTVSVVGARSDVRRPAPRQTADRGVLAGVPQHATVLGSRTAPVTLVEYADLQCPYCARWAVNAFPELVRDYVRTGRVRMVFRGLAFLGPDSETALRAAVAAGEQDRLWDVVHRLYAIQGPENGGWVTERMLARVGASVPGLDARRMLDRRWSPQVERELGAAAADAERDHIPGTPTFLAGPTGGKLHPIALASLDAGPIRARLDELLAR